MTGGWTNQGETTLVIPTGATTGARIVLDGTTGEIQVYNSANALVGQWGGPTGCLFDYESPGTRLAELCAAQLQFSDQSNPPTTRAAISATSNNTNSQLNLDSGQSAGQHHSFMTLFSGVAGSTDYIEVAQLNQDGRMVSTDDISSPNLMHVASYTGSVVDGFGDVVIAHGAHFTPSKGLLMPWDFNSAGQGWMFEWFQNPFNATNMSFFVRQQGGGIPGIGTTVGCHAVLFG